MPLIGRIRDEALSTLTEAKMIKAEQGPAYVKKLVDKLIKKAAKADKSELIHIPNYEIFLTFTYLINSENFSYDETVNYCEEAKKMINAWTFEKDGRRLDICESKTNEDGSLNDWTCVNTMTELGLTPVFVNYSMKLVYIAMYHFLKLKKDILSQSDQIKRLPIPQRMQWMKGVYKNNNFSNFVEFAKDILAQDEKDHAFRQDISGKRIKVTEEVLSMVEDETIDNLTEIPDNWHQYFRLFSQAASSQMQNEYVFLVLCQNALIRKCTRFLKAALTFLQERLNYIAVPMYELRTPTHLH